MRSPTMKNTRSFAVSTTSNDDEEELPDFDPSDPIFKVWCDCRIIPAFISILFVQFILTFAALIFSTYQIISIEHWHARESSNLSTIKNFSSHFEITFFLCQHWYPIIYVRLLILLCVTFCIFVAWYGLQTAKIRCIKIYIVSIFVFILFLLSYVALLAWHAIKNGDYFSFCFVGLTIFSMLLLNVSALHFAAVLTKFMNSRKKFIEYAKEKCLINDDFNGNSTKKSSLFFCWSIMSKYDVPDDIRLKAHRELNTNNGGAHRYRLCEIEEETE